MLGMPFLEAVDQQNHRCKSKHSKGNPESDILFLAVHSLIAGAGLNHFFLAVLLVEGLELAVVAAVVLDALAVFLAVLHVKAGVANRSACVGVELLAVPIVNGEAL